MNKKGPIIIIEDDPDDQQFISDALAEAGNSNEIMFFSDGISVLNYLTTSKQKPFIIISDINLPILNGLELRERIHSNNELSLKCIPYIFLTTTVNPANVTQAYATSVQGFFTKPLSYQDLVRVIHNIIEYWKNCYAPPL